MSDDDDYVRARLEEMLPRIQLGVESLLNLYTRLESSESWTKDAMHWAPPEDER